MVRRLLALLAVWVLAVVASLAVAAPAKADDASELPFCGLATPSIGNAAYTAHGVAVMITVNWQYVAGSSSACEDINIQPADGHSWNLMSPRKARTYMCSLSNPNNCWYNAWRDIGASGGVVATDMLSGVRFQVHLAIGGDDGPWARLYT